jgi:dipeptidase E
MKLILAGGGGAAESRAADELFAHWLAPGRNLLYWPVALRGAMPFSACYAWITSTFSDLDVNAIDMWDDLASHAIDELDAYAGVYIGGGNTYSLLNEMRQSGFDQKLVSCNSREVSRCD